MVYQGLLGYHVHRGDRVGGILASGLVPDFLSFKDVIVAVGGGTSLTFSRFFI